MNNIASEWKKITNFKELPYEEFIRVFSNIHDSYYEEKIDGMLGAMVYDEEIKPYFITTTGIKIDNLPVLDEYENILNLLGIKSCVLIGELVGISNGKVLRFNESMSVIKTSRLEKNKKLIHHFLYDVFYLNGKRNTYFSFSYKFFKENFWNKKFDFIHFPKIEKNGLDKFEKLYKESIDKNYIDGIVVRTHKGNYKVKPFRSVDCVLIGVGRENMISWNRNQIAFVIPAFMIGKNEFVLTSNVGSGFTHNERISFFNYYKQKNLGEIKNRNGGFFIHPNIIIEIQYRDFHIQNQDSYIFEKGKFIYKGKKKSVSLIMPTFLRIRNDKIVDEYDLRLSQIPDI